DSAGVFSFPEAYAGQYIVRVTRPGYAERRIPVELQRGERREVAVVLVPSFKPAMARDSAALLDLGSRMAFGFRQERMSGMDLEKHGDVQLCQINEIVNVIGSDPTMIVN